MTITYAHYSAAIEDPRWRWPNFTPQEMACKATGILLVNPRFMDKLQTLRSRYERPITIVSGYRTAAYNARVSANRSLTGAHTHARAVDLYVQARERAVPLLLDLAWQTGFTRCGLQLSNLHFRLHLDDMTAEDGFAVRPDERGLFCWTY